LVFFSLRMRNFFAPSLTVSAQLRGLERLRFTSGSKIALQTAKVFHEVPWASSLSGMLRWVERHGVAWKKAASLAVFIAKHSP
jgi:hypothetical protein